MRQVQTRRPPVPPPALRPKQSRAPGFCVRVCVYSLGGRSAAESVLLTGDALVGWRQVVRQAVEAGAIGFASNRAVRTPTQHVMDYPRTRRPLITSDCDATRVPAHQTALNHLCARFQRTATGTCRATRCRGPSPRTTRCWPSQGRFTRPEVRAPGRASRGLFPRKRKKGTVYSSKKTPAFR